MKEFHIKYRPKRLEDLVGQTSVVATLREKLSSKSLPHTLMFEGGSGLGKTTTARILKREMKCNDLDFTQINCADFRGIDMIRDIRLQMKRSPHGACKIYVIEEGHQLSKDAMEAALLIIEEPPDDCYFIICTTNPDKFIPTFLNRCTRLKFTALSQKEMKGLLETTLKKENKAIGGEVIERIIDVAGGSARLGMNLLNRVVGLKTEDEQLDAIVKSDSKRQSSDLVKALLWEKPDWNVVRKILEGIEDDPEQIRHLVLANATKTLLGGGKQAGRAYNVICNFENNFYDSKRAGLVRACWECVNK